MLKDARHLRRHVLIAPEENLDDIDPSVPQLALGLTVLLVDRPEGCCFFVGEFERPADEIGPLGGQDIVGEFGLVAHLLCRNRIGDGDHDGNRDSNENDLFHRWIRQISESTHSNPDYTERPVHCWW